MAIKEDWQKVGKAYTEQFALEVAHILVPAFSYAMENASGRDEKVFRD